ncbi:MAG: CAP domain-containing protein, partial [Ktedonobacteraceae bacterium]
MTKHTNVRKATHCESNTTTSSFKEPGNGRRLPLLLASSILVLLVVFLSACGSTNTGASTSSAKATSTSQIKKHDTCAPQATLPADIPASGTFDTGANVITTFNNARQQEGCAVPLSIDPAAYDAASPQMQELMVINAERQDRGLPALQLDSTLLSQIDTNHSKEFVQYNYFAHPSPINQPGGKTDPSSRITVNPAVNGQFCCAEDIAGGGPAADAIYRFMYVDSDSNWGHRENILGFNSNVDANAGHYTWIGIGIATGGQFGFYTTLDFLEDTAATPYTPPATADTQAP